MFLVRRFVPRRYVFTFDFYVWFCLGTPHIFTISTYLLNREWFFHWAVPRYFRAYFKLILPLHAERLKTLASRKSNGVFTLDTIQETLDEYWPKPKRSLSSDEKSKETDSIKEKTSSKRIEEKDSPIHRKRKFQLIEDDDDDSNEQDVKHVSRVENKTRDEMLRQSTNDEILRKIAAEGELEEVEDEDVVITKFHLSNNKKKTNPMVEYQSIEYDEYGKQIH